MFTSAWDIVNGRNYNQSLQYLLAFKEKSSRNQIGPFDGADTTAVER